MAKKAIKKKVYKITPAHDKFCEYYAEHGNATMAYLHANPKVKYNTAKTNGTELLTITDIIDRVDQIKEVTALKYNQTKESTIRDLIASAEEAKEAGQFAAYSKMREMIIKMCGFYTPKKVDVTSNGESIVFNYIKPTKEDK